MTRTYPSLRAGQGILRPHCRAPGGVIRCDSTQWRLESKGTQDGIDITQPNTICTGSPTTGDVTCHEHTTGGVERLTPRPGPRRPLP